jgi:hypothetical protein
MPVHDWTRVSAGTFHDFHCTWIPALKNLLNDGLLPDDFYAQVEQVAGDVTPDILTLHAESGNGAPLRNGGGGTAVAVLPPRVSLTTRLETNAYVAKARRLVIRHTSGDRVVALIEILSPGNKSSELAMKAFLAKATDTISQGYHLMLIDLFPPTSRDLQGIHGAVWKELGDASYVAPPNKPLTLVSYAAGAIITAYIEPCAVGDVLIPMPLFLTPDYYVSVPLEETYLAAYRGVPRRWREVLENTA